MISAADDDSKLIQLLKQSDENALRVLLSRYIEPLTRFAHSVVGSLDVAEEIVQRVVVRLWENRANLDTERSIKAYLYRAVKNEGLKEYRSNRVRSTYIKTVQLESFLDEQSKGFRSAENDSLTRLTIAEAIENLSERRMIAVRLRYESDMSYQEMGEIMGISPAAAMQLTLRALDDLRILIEV